MTTVDFTALGYAGVALPLEVAEVDRCVGAAPLIVLMAENHLNVVGIARAVRTAARLADAGVVDFFGVEGSLDGTATNLRRSLAARSQSLPGYSREVLAELGGDEGAIAAMAARPGFEFVTTLQVLRPSLTVVSVEDAALAFEVGREHDRLVARHTATAAAEGADDRLTIAREFRSLGVNRRRERAFVENSLVGRQAAGTTPAVLLNAGGHHQVMLFAQLAERGASVLHLRPEGYADALA